VLNTVNEVLARKQHKLPTHGLRMNRIGITLSSLIFVVGCGGAAATTSPSSSSGGSQQVVDLSPTALSARYEANGQRLTRGAWATPPGPLASHASSALTALRSWATMESHSETYLTLEVISPDWSNVTDNRTSAVVGRSFAGVALARMSDGRCFQYAGSFVQDSTGGGFSNTLRANGVGGGFEVPCEMVDVVTARAGVAQ
jgi:hypothetical protein